MNKPLLILFFVVIIDLLGFGILVPLIPYMADNLGASPELITPILGTYSLCQLIAAPVWGRLSDRYGRRPILMISLAGACASYAVLGLSTTIAGLLASRVLGGFMAGNVSAAFAYASDVSTPEKRAGALGMVGAAIGLGFMIGPGLGGLLVGDDSYTANFAVPAVVSCGLSLLAIGLVYFALPESHGSEKRAMRESQRGASPLKVLSERPGLRYVAGAALLVLFSQATLETIFAIWAMNRFGFGPRTVGLTLFGLAAIVVVMQGGLVRMLAPRFGEVRLAVAGVASYIIGLLTVASSPGYWVTMLGLAFCGIGAGAFTPSASALASKQATGADRGSVMGTYQAAGSLARVIAPFLAGTIYARVGTWAPFVVGAMVTLPAAWLVMRSERYQPAAAAA